MKEELRRLLLSYVKDECTLLDCEEWLAGLDRSDGGIATFDRQLIGGLELFAHEAGEGLRPEVDFCKEAVRFLLQEHASNLVYTTSGSTKSRTVYHEICV